MLAFDDKRLVSSNVVPWPKDIYAGYRKTRKVRPITTSTYTLKLAKVNTPPRTHFHPKPTQTTKICVGTDPTMEPIWMNGTLKKTSNVLPVHNCVSMMRCCQVWKIPHNCWHFSRDYKRLSANAMKSNHIGTFFKMHFHCSLLFLFLPFKNFKFKAAFPLR